MTPHGAEPGLSEELLCLRDLIETKTGLSLPAEKLDQLAYPFTEPGQPLCSTIPGQALRAIAQGSREGAELLNHIVAAVATNETYFFGPPAPAPLALAPKFRGLPAISTSLRLRPLGSSPSHFEGRRDVTF